MRLVPNLLAPTHYPIFPAAWPRMCAFKVYKIYEIHMVTAKEIHKYKYMTIQLYMFDCIQLKSKRSENILIESDKRTL